MKEPLKVAECMKAMQDAVKIPCTVKCRLGVDNFDTYDFVKDFVDIVSTNSSTRYILYYHFNILNNMLFLLNNNYVIFIKYYQ
jgi:tRNA-dihydrouridine synthase A